MCLMRRCPLCAAWDFWLPLWLPTTAKGHKEAWEKSEKRRQEFDDSAAADMDEATLNTLFAWVGDAIERQMGSADATDSKLTWVFTAAAVVIGLAGITSGWSNGGSLVVGVLLAVASAAFLLAALWAINGIWSRDWDVARRPNYLYDEYVTDGGSKSACSFKHMTFWDIARGYELNGAMLAGKSLCLRRCLIMVSVEAGVVSVAVIYKHLY